MGKDFQEKFNLRKGSIPARLNVNMDKFDACAQTSSKDFVATEKTDALLPSVAIDMAVAPVVHDALRAVVSEFWTTDKMSVNDAVSKLVLASAAKQK